MHALPGQDVKRTFSGSSAKFAGLPGQSTLEPDRQELGDFSDEFGGPVYFAGGFHKRREQPRSAIV